MLRAETEPNDRDLIWNRYSKRYPRQVRRFDVFKDTQGDATHYEIIIEVIKRVSAFTGGLTAAPPTYHLIHRLLEMTR